jgi:hypothetical protein
MRICREISLRNEGMPQGKTGRLLFFSFCLPVFLFDLGDYPGGRLCRVLFMNCQNSSIAILLGLCWYT